MDDVHTKKYQSFNTATKKNLKLKSSILASQADADTQLQQMSEKQVTFSFILNRLRIRHF